MKRNYIFYLLLISLAACNSNSKNTPAPADVPQTRIFKGLYSFGPEVRTFTACDGNMNYWVIDSAKNLELSYSKFNFEKPYEPVYIEAEGYLTSIDSLNSSADFDSTLVVTKLKVISQNIPADSPCSME